DQRQNEGDQIRCRAKDRDRDIVKRRVDTREYHLATAGETARDLLRGVVMPREIKRVDQTDDRDKHRDEGKQSPPPAAAIVEFWCHLFAGAEFPELVVVAG